MEEVNRSALVPMGSSKELQSNKKSKNKKVKVVSIKISKGSRMGIFIEAIRNHLSCLGPFRGTKASLESLKKNQPVLYQSTRKFLRAMSKDILGTWEPVHKFRLGSVQTVTGSTAIITTVLGISFQGCALADEFELIFDEVQPVGPFQVTFHSYITSTTHEHAIGVIDYDNNGVLASIEGALAYDTAKIFVLNPYFVGEESVPKWEGHVQGYPDKNWISIASTSNVAYWKAYSYANTTGSTTYGTLNYTCLFRLRQMVGAV